DKAGMCMKAIRAAQEALCVFSTEDSPEDYAEAKGSLWLAHLTLADIEYRAENCSLALEACEERLESYRAWAAQPLQFASCCKDVAITAIMLADMEISVQAKAEDCKKAISAALESLQIYNVRIHPEEYAEAKILLWAAYSALAEVEEKRENCKKAIEACESAIRVYERISPAEHADALKNLGYSFITLAEIGGTAENCRKAIEAYEQAMQYYTLERAPMEHAEILRDLAFAHVTLSAVEDKEECSKKALKAYKKAFKIYQTRSEELERQSDPGAHEMESLAEKCHRSMQSCKAIFKAGRKAGAAAPTQERSGE
ncbi:MAG: tetratricopeptide repeat protein, partial [Methanotrichaceae archaeon]|nr:tetratricopeptide repeat protein [Methanotrichaceae archaeon]